MKQKQTFDIYNLWYYTTLVVSMINTLRVYSLWGFYEVIGPFFHLLSILLSLLLFVFNIPRYKGRGILLLFISFLFILMVGINSEMLFFLWTSFVLVIGAKGLLFRDIVKVHFIVSLCFCLLNVFGYEIGALKQANYYIDAIREGVMGDFVQRYDYGYGWATDFANHVFFILLDLWILLKGKIGFLWFTVYMAMVAVILFKADSRLAAGLILLLVIISLYLMWKTFRHKQVSRFIKWGLVVSIPVFVVLSIWATIAYDPSNLYWFATNILVSNRLQFGSDAILEYGISLFGQPVEMHGALDAGGGNEYNFVDSTYVQYLIRYGAVPVVIIVFLYCRMALQSLKRNDVIVLFAFFLAGISGIIAQFVFDYKYCVLILALMATHNHYCFKAVEKKNPPRINI